MLPESQNGGAGEGEAEQEAHGEFGTEHPGYCGAPDRSYVGTLKGAGRICQHHIGRSTECQIRSGFSHGVPAEWPPGAECP